LLTDLSTADFSHAIQPLTWHDPQLRRRFEAQQHAVDKIQNLCEQARIDLPTRPLFLMMVLFRDEFLLAEIPDEPRFHHAASRTVLRGAETDPSSNHEEEEPNATPRWASAKRHKTTQ